MPINQAAMYLKIYLHSLISRHSSAWGLALWWWVDGRERKKEGGGGGGRGEEGESACLGLKT